MMCNAHWLCANAYVLLLTEITRIHAPTVQHGIGTSRCRILNSRDRSSTSELGPIYPFESLFETRIDIEETMTRIQRREHTNSWC